MQNGFFLIVFGICDLRNFGINVKKHKIYMKTHEIDESFFAYVIESLFLEIFTFFCFDEQLFNSFGFLINHLQT